MWDFSWRWDFLRSEDIYPWNRGFLKSGNFFPGIWDFQNSGDFFHQGLGIYKIWGLLSHGIGNFLKSGDFYPRDFYQIGDILSPEFLGLGIFRGW